MHALNQVVDAWDQVPTSVLPTASFSLAGVALTVTSDDPPFLAELSSTLGRPRPLNGEGASFAASIRTQGGPQGWGHLKLELGGDPAMGPAELLLGLTSPEFPFRLLDSAEPSWTCLALREETEALFALRGADCVFRQVPPWRTAMALLLFHRLLRLRDDAIFFHAASLGLKGRGILLVGPKGTGKSTTALALVSRGHDFLGDETACVVPSSGEILPFRRPVGIKPGPRAKEVHAALARAGRDPEKEGVVRIEIDSLLPVRPPVPARLAAVVFLGGFSPEPRLARIDPGRKELALLQPIVSSLVNAPPSRRVFEMVRLLAGVTAYRLFPGDPDETAEHLERILEEEWA